MSRRVESSEDKDNLGDHEEASKQGMSIEDIDKDHWIRISSKAQLEAELIEEERLCKEKEEEASDIALLESWDYTQLRWIGDYEHIEQKKETFCSMLRAEEEKNESRQTKCSKRNLICLLNMSLKNMGGYKHNQLKSKSYEEIQKMFDNEMRERKEQQQESSKRQRMEDVIKTYENEEVKEVDEAELKKNLVIVKDDDIAIDVIPLATKPPVIVEYKLLKEGINGQHYH
ncbi:hypothetical protein Tco_0800141 [Tanacetum coccineum]|uniref:Uncharacterized protein n=1 Tax=Tanacetum coccineum TaxID=301880 RepID=A0ABQ4ZWP1_9ASTR